MTLVPLRSVVTRSASFSLAKCTDMVGFVRSKCAASSPAVIGPFLSRVRTSRRTGWDSASNTSFMVIIHTYLEIYLIRVKAKFDDDRHSSCYNLLTASIGTE